MSDWLAKVSAAMDAAKAEFGEPVTYTPVGGDAVEITAIPEDEYVEADGFTHAVTGTTGTQISVKLADLPGGEARRNDQVLWRGIEYLVKEDRPDGQGNTTLILHRDPGY